MPLTHFKQDGEQWPVEEVLSDPDHPLLERYPRSYLEACADDREWTGVPSVTQLLNGARQEVLKIREDYAVDPEDRTWMVLGTRAHHRLEQHAKAVGLSAELRLRLPEGLSGMRDLLEPYEGYHRVVDYKVLGSYRVAQLANVKADQSSEKRREVWFDYAMQLNAYRLMAREEGHELHPRWPVWLFMIIRDGGTRAAHSRGIHEKTAFLPAPVWPDDKVRKWFGQRAAELQSWLKWKDRLPPLCDDRESWEGRRCDGFCDVADQCKEARRDERARDSA